QQKHTGAAVEAGNQRAKAVVERTQAAFAAGSGHRLLLTERSVPQPSAKAPLPCGGDETSTVETFGQAVQVLGHALEVLADLGPLLGLPRALVAQMSDPHDLLVDVLGDMALLFRSRGHLLAHAGDAA